MSPPLFDRGYVRIAEGLIHFRRRGDGVPLVMLHASPSSSQSVEPLAGLLAGAVLMPDTPGNGASSPPHVKAPAVADYAAMLDRACAALGHDQVDLYGTHTGAHIAVEWAIAHPARVRRLILDGVALLSAADRAEFLAHYAPPQVPDASGSQFLWAWNMIRDQMLFWPHFKKDAAHLRRDAQLDPRLLHDLTMDLLNCLETYHQPYEAVFRHPVLERLPLVRQPTLWLQGEGGPLDTEAADALARLPAATQVMTPDLPARANAIMNFLATGGTR